MALTTNRTYRRNVLAAAACCCLAGCLAAPDETDERLEHHIPAHKPATLVAAIAELERRNPGATSRHEAAGNSERDRAELRDIIGWLPELAADSDLRKSEWESIQQSSAELARAVEAWDAAASGARSGPQRQYEEVLERLRAACRSIDSSPQSGPMTRESSSHGASAPSPDAASSTEGK
jgi:hypothetical protein